eukprot:COSAG05_NODE_8944_length_659_cov_1.083929_1_plen_122_part_00
MPTCLYQHFNLDTTEIHSVIFWDGSESSSDLFLSIKTNKTNHVCKRAGMRTRLRDHGRPAQHEADASVEAVAAEFLVAGLAPANAFDTLELLHNADFLAEHFWSARGARAAVSLYLGVSAV